MNRTGFCFKVRRGFPADELTLRHETTTVTLWPPFVTGFPNRNAYARSPAGRMLSRVTPGAGSETPALVAT